MGAPEAPEAPDPLETAGAQTGTNVSTAIANNMMGMVDQTGPNGSLSYNQTGTYDWTDPTTGQTYTLPRYEAVTSLTPDGQRTFDRSQDAQYAMADTAANSAEFLRSYLGDAGSMPVAPNYDMVNGAPSYRSMSESGLPQYQSMYGSPALQNVSADARYSRFSESPRNSTVSGRNLPDYRRVRGPERYGRNIGSAGRITRSYGTDFSEDRRRVEEALLQRMSPEMERDEEALRSRLQQQGITIGSDAYNAEMDRAGRARNDARLGAILSGGQEQSRLADLEARRAGFENAAQAQAFGQNAARASFANDARRAQFTDAMTATQANNAIESQSLQDLLGLTGFNNAARNQTWQQNMAATQANNAAQSQSLQDRFQAAGINNQNAQSQFGMDAQARGFNNAMQGQSLQDLLNVRGYNNDLQSRSWQQNMAATQANNATRTQGMQNQFALRNQPINEITALLSGSQVSQPNYGITQPSGIATTDVAGLINQGYENQYNTYAQQMEQRNNLLGGLFSLFAA